MTRLRQRVHQSKYQQRAQDHEKASKVVGHDGASDVPKLNDGDRDGDRDDASPKDVNHTHTHTDIHTHTYSHAYTHIYAHSCWVIYLNLHT